MLPSTKLRVLAASSDRFGALYYPYCLTSHALRLTLLSFVQGLLPVMGFHLTGPGLPRLVVLPFAGRTKRKTWDV